MKLVNHSAAYKCFSYYQWELWHWCSRWYWDIPQSNCSRGFTIHQYLFIHSLLNFFDHRPVFCCKFCVFLCTAGAICTLEAHSRGLVFYS